MIGHLFTALRAGAELSNATAWKKGGIAVASLTALLSALSGIAVARGWIPTEIDPETIMQISSGIVALVGLFLGWVQAATTTRVGLLPEAPRHEIPPIDPVELSRRVRAGEFADADRLLPDAAASPARVQFQSKPFADPRGAFNPDA